MMEACTACEKEILTEADSYGLVSTRKGHKIYCPTCFAEVMDN